MKKRFWLLVLEFFAVTIPLAWLWLEWGRLAYLELFVKLSTPFLMFLGVTSYEPKLILEHFINYVPFLVLMIITPKLTIKRRIIGTLIGFVIIFFDHVMLASVAFVAYSNYGLTEKAFSTLFPALLFSDSLPFILWAIIAAGYLKQFVPKVFKKTE